MTRPARWWFVFWAGNLIVALALLWTTRVVVVLEQSELHARAATAHQESLRLALWRMDSWLALLLARESALPPEAAVEAKSEGYIGFRFEIDADGQITSPQPERLSEQVSYLGLPGIRGAMERADLLLSAALTPALDTRPLITDVDWSRMQLDTAQSEFDSRVACGFARPPGSDGGRQLVVWLDGADSTADSALTFLRRHADGQSFSGYVLEWPRIERRLLDEIVDLFPEARLERVVGHGDPPPAGHGLANIPVTLWTPPPTPSAANWITGGRTALVLAWLAILVAAVAVGLTLRKSIELGERRRRFASAVTHELRTPLTTFQLYAEMLADGLIQDEAQRKEYLLTLKHESRRLSATVDNVLTYARVEQHKRPRQLEQIGLEALVERLRPSLARRVESSDLRLEIVTDRPSATVLSVDPNAIGQILGNLVDNAAKYASKAVLPSIRIVAAVNRRSLTLTVRDHGPGVPRQQARAIFAAFERGGRDPASAVPGLGLGLALARDLARDMGGDVTLEHPDGGGALFRLELPAS